MDVLLNRRVRAVWLDDGRTKTVVGKLVKYEEGLLVIEGERERNIVVVGKAGLVSMKEEPPSQRTL